MRGSKRQRKKILKRRLKSAMTAALTDRFVGKRLVPNEWHSCDTICLSMIRDLLFRVVREAAVCPLP